MHGARSFREHHRPGDRKSRRRLRHHRPVAIAAAPARSWRWITSAGGRLRCAGRAPGSARRAERAARGGWPRGPRGRETAGRWLPVARGRRRMDACRQWSAAAADHASAASAGRPPAGIPRAFLGVALRGAGTKMALKWRLKFLSLKNIASLPFIHKHVAVMPDVHLGKGATIGSVIPTKGAIVPAAVGVDLGCGMMAVRTSIRAEHLPDSLRDSLRHREGRPARPHDSG